MKRTFALLTVLGIIANLLLLRGIIVPAIALRRHKNGLWFRGDAGPRIYEHASTKLPFITWEHLALMFIGSLVIQVPFILMSSYLFVFSLDYATAACYLVVAFVIAIVRVLIGRAFVARRDEIENGGEP